MVYDDRRHSLSFHSILCLLYYDSHFLPYILTTNPHVLCQFLDVPCDKGLHLACFEHLFLPFTFLHIVGTSYGVIVTAISLHKLC